MNPLKQKIIEKFEKDGLKDLSDEIAEIVDWINKQDNCQVETDEQCPKCHKSTMQGSGLSAIPCNGKNLMGYCHTHKQQHSKCHDFKDEYCCNAGLKFLKPSCGIHPEDTKKCTDTRHTIKVGGSCLCGQR